MGHSLLTSTPVRKKPIADIGNLVEKMDVITRGMDFANVHYIAWRAADK
jgi:hypothetical protein